MCVAVAERKLCVCSLAPVGILLMSFLRIQGQFYISLVNQPQCCFFFFFSHELTHKKSTPVTLTVCFPRQPQGHLKLDRKHIPGAPTQPLNDVLRGGAAVSGGGAARPGGADAHVLEGRTIPRAERGEAPERLPATQLLSQV